jgi:hypothetical protein
MIAFDMECSNGHIFEGWFNNAQSFDEQNSKKLISCPFCNDTNIRKMISPVTMKIASQDNREKMPHPINYRRLAKEVVEYIHNHFEDAGPEFTKQALKMHYGVIEKKNIKGSATMEEEKLLKDEGVDFFKVPFPKFDKDKKN